MSESESLLSRVQQGDLACGPGAAKNSLETRAACCPCTPCVCRVGGPSCPPHGEASCCWPPWGTAEPCQLLGGEEQEGGGSFHLQKCQASTWLHSWGSTWSPGRCLNPGLATYSWVTFSTSPLVSVSQVRILSRLASGCGAASGPHLDPASARGLGGWRPLSQAPPPLYSFAESALLPWLPLSP